MADDSKKDTASTSMFLWWKVSESELQRQLEGYGSLGWKASARKISAGLLILSALITLAFMSFQQVSNAAIVDIVLLLFLAQFTLGGQRWAVEAAMLLWTLEKGYLLYTSLTSHNFGGPLMQVVWWALYMKYFYMAWRVEKERAKVPPPNQQVHQEQEKTAA